MHAFKPFWLSCWMLGALTAVGCQPERAFLVIAVSGLSAQAQTLEIRAVLEDSNQDASERFDGLSGPSATVSLWLPPGAAGKLTVNATELQSSCSVGAGTVKTVVAGQAKLDVAVELGAPSPPLCEVTIDRTGDGTGLVTVEPPASGAPLLCGDRCTFKAALGATVTLHAQVMAPGYFSQWSGPCTPSSSLGMACQLQVGAGGIHVGAEFLSRSCAPGTFCNESPVIHRPPSQLLTYLIYRTVWGASSQDVWVSARPLNPNPAGALLHRRGGWWSEEIPRPVPIIVEGIFGLNDKDIWFVGSENSLAAPGMAMHWDGQGWLTAPLPTTFAVPGVWGSAANQFFAIPTDGTVLQWDGVSWRAGTAQQPRVSVSGIWGLSSSKIWITGSGLYEYNGNNTWLRDPAVSTTNFREAIWGTSAADYWIVGPGDVSYHRVNGQLQSAGLPSGPNTIYTSIFGTSPSDVWTVGTDGTIHHFDGVSWKLRMQTAGTIYYRVFSPALNDVYVVGDNGSLLHSQP